MREIEQIRLGDQWIRLREHMGRAFSASADPDWLARANDNKAALRELLGLEHPDSAILLPVVGGSGDYVVQLTNLILATELERVVATGNEAVALHEQTIYDHKNAREIVVSEIDPDTLGYKVGKQQAKLSRRMAGVSIPVLQVLASRLRECDLVGYIPDGPKDRLISEIMRMVKEGVSKTRLMYVLTADPVALLRSSSFGCTSSSCHRPGGEYQFGAFGYAQDPWTVMGVAVSPSCPDYATEVRNAGGYIQGRMLFHIPEPGQVPAFVQARQYGTVPETAPKAIRTYIQGRLRSMFGLPAGGVWQTTTNDTIAAERPRFCYVDHNYFKGYYLTEDGRKGLIEAFDWENMRLRCPSCDSRGSTDERNPFDCGCFAGDKCCACGCAVDLESGGFSADNGDVYCDSCNPYLYCGQCGGSALEDEMTYINGEGYCDYCRDQRFTRCDDCGEYVETTYEVHYGTQGYVDTVCEDCLGDTSECPGCEELWRDDDMETGSDEQNYCPGCFSDLFTECEECGDVISADETRCESCKEAEETTTEETTDEETTDEETTDEETTDEETTTEEFPQI